MKRSRETITVTKITNLPRDLVEEVLSRLPLTSLRSVRSVCKNWNTLSRARGGSFAKKHLAVQAKLAEKQREFMVVMMIEFTVYLMSLNLHKSNVESFIKPHQGKLISLDDEIEHIYEVYTCDGLLLCIPSEKTKVMVWNPYWGKIRWIESTPKTDILWNRYAYALGHDRCNQSYKILKFVEGWYTSKYKIYDCNSDDSWRDLDATSDGSIGLLYNGRTVVSLKGNAYWLARALEDSAEERKPCFLLCFDFTSEKLGPRLPLPFVVDVSPRYTLSLSTVREEKLVVLYQPWSTLKMEIWVTTKIEPNAVSWNSKVFLKADIIPGICFTRPSFFIDEEKKVAVLFDKGRELRLGLPNNVVYIFGVDGSKKEVNLNGKYLKAELNHKLTAGGYWRKISRD